MVGRKVTGMQKEGLTGPLFQLIFNEGDGVVGDPVFGGQFNRQVVLKTQAVY